jgi:hypothetical protein
MAYKEEVKRFGTIESSALKAQNLKNLNNTSLHHYTMRQPFKEHVKSSRLSAAVERV